MNEKIEHSALQGLSRDSHPQYIYLNPDKDTRNIILPCNASVTPITIRGALGQKSPLLRVLDFQGKDKGEICEDKIKFGAGIFDEVEAESGKIKNITSDSGSIENLSAGDISCRTINKRNLDAELDGIYKHTRTRERHLSNEEISHQRMIGCGQNTHADIDSHISDTNIHFTKTQISHKDIQDKGNIPHKDIDSHIYDKNIHFTQDQISHSSLRNKDLDEHPQYLLSNGNRVQTKLEIEKSLKVGEEVECASLKVGKIINNLFKSSSALIDRIKTKIIECNEIVSESVRTNNIDTKKLTSNEVSIDQDLVVGGSINGVDLLAFIERYSRHLANNDKQEYHELFTQSRPGFVPAPPYSNNEYQLIDGLGRWKGIGEYLELIIEEGVFTDFLSDRRNKWSFAENYIIIPFSGIFQIEVGDKFITINNKIVEKSVDYERVLLLLNKNDVLHLWEGPEEYKLPERGKITLYRIDDLGIFE